MPQSLVVVPRPETVDPEFAKLRARRNQLNVRVEGLIREGELAQAAARNADVDRIRAEAKVASSELAAIQSGYKVAEMDACALAREHLTSDKGYRQLVGAAAANLSARLEPWIRLQSVLAEAGGHGVRVAGLPASIRDELAQAKAWCRHQVLVGALDAASLPPALKALLEVPS